MAGLDDFVDQLQREFFEETRQAYGEKMFERWQNPLYMGVLEDPDGQAKLKGTCGDSMEIALKFRDGRIVDAAFQTDGCGPSVVCGSYAAELALGKTPDEALDVTGDQILEALDGLPEENVHCAYLAAAALQEALNDYMIRKTPKTGKN